MLRVAGVMSRLLSSRLKTPAKSQRVTRSSAMPDWPRRWRRLLVFGNSGRARRADLMRARAVTGRVYAEPVSSTKDDRALVEHLYASEAPALARRRQGSSERDEPLDLVHDAFVRLLGLGPERLRVLQREKPAAYLWRIARHIGLDGARRDKRRAVGLHVPLDDVEIAGPDMERQLDARDALRRVEQAVKAMRPRTRAIFIAHRVEGMSYAEIARSCGISVKGVEKQMSRAIAILAREMDRQPDV